MAYLPPLEARQRCSRVFSKSQIFQNLYKMNMRLQIKQNKCLVFLKAWSQKNSLNKIIKEFPYGHIIQRWDTAY